MNERIQYYDRQIDRNNLTYQLNTHNCSTLAMELLCCGASREFHGAKNLSQLVTSIKRAPFSRDHSRLFELTRELLEEFAVTCQRRGYRGPLEKFLLPAILIDLISREFMWVPGDVDKVASKLAMENH